MQGYIQMDQKIYEANIAKAREEVKQNMTLINAKEARQKTATYISERDQSQLNELASLINRKIEVEHVYTFYYGKQISASVKAKLEAEQYKVVDYSSQREGICYQISW